MSVFGRRSQITCNTAGSVSVHTSAADMETHWEGSEVSALKENEGVPLKMYRERVFLCSQTEKVAVNEHRVQKESFLAQVS